MDFVPCIKWVGKGVLRSTPEKVELTREELQQILREEEAASRENDGDEEVGEDYDMEHYDEETGNDNTAAGLRGIAVYEPSENDNYINAPGMDDADTDDEDDIINPEDNLILIGKGIRDNSSSEVLEVHVYNEETGDSYPHHDILISSCPLALEPLVLPGPVAFVAIGLMSSLIELYDLNVINPMLPHGKLGSKKKKKETGHTEAVLDLAWNKSYSHILASSSADSSVILWDLETLSLSDRFDRGKGHVESILWEPGESHNLLSGDSNGKVALLDCRTLGPADEWKIQGGAPVLSYSRNADRFYVGSSKGRIMCFDKRCESPVWDVEGHGSDVTGLACIEGYNGLMVSTSVGGEVKLWDLLASSPPRTVWEKTVDSEELHTLHMCPDNPLLAALGGAKKRGAFFSLLHLNKKSSLDELFDSRKITDSSMS